MARRSGVSQNTALSLGSLAWAVSSTAHAQSSLEIPSLEKVIPVAFQNIDSAFGLIWNTMVGVSGIAFLGLLLYGGFLYLTSAGNDQIADRGKHTIRDAAIGIALVVLAWPIGVLILNFFQVGDRVLNNPSSGLQLPSASSTTPLNQSSGTNGTTGGNTSTEQNSVPVPQSFSFLDPDGTRTTNASVFVERKNPDGTYTTVTSGSVGSTGSFDVATLPANSQIRLTVTGSNGVAVCEYVVQSDTQPAPCKLQPLP